MGIGRDQGKSACDQLTAPWNSTGWDSDSELRGGHCLGDIPGLGVVLERTVQGGEGSPKLRRFDCGGLGPRQSEL